LLLWSLLLAVYAKQQIHLISKSACRARYRDWDDGRRDLAAPIKMHSHHFLRAADGTRFVMGLATTQSQWENQATSSRTDPSMCQRASA
jgi:hypothetical protein